VSADAFQIYRGLDLLTAKPEPHLLDAVPHHLIGTIPASEKMNAEKFRVLAIGAIRAIHARGRCAFVVGGNGMYIQRLRMACRLCRPRTPNFASN
jgi:tRNA dimethylallyltransferase